MFCPQCGVQTEQQTKFCKSCGLKLADHVQLLAASREAEPERLSQPEAQRQLRWLKGTRLLLISLLLAPPATIFIAAGATAHGEEQTPLGIIAFLLFFLWLVSSGRGLYHILRSGFFQTYKQRRIRAEAALLNQPAMAATPQPAREMIGAPFAKSVVDTDRYQMQPVAGVTEHTTRELQAARESGKIV